MPPLQAHHHESPLPVLEQWIYSLEEYQPLDSYGRWWDGELSVSTTWTSVSPVELEISCDFVLTYLHFTTLADFHTPSEIVLMME